MPDDPSDTNLVKPWSIRGVPPEERNAAIEAAKRSDMNIGDWMVRAIRTAIQQETQANRAPVPVGQPMSDRQTELLDIERAVTQMRDLAAAGVPVSPRHASRITGAIIATLPKRQRPAVTQKAVGGQTSDDRGQTPSA